MFNYSAIFRITAIIQFFIAMLFCFMIVLSMIFFNEEVTSFIKSALFCLGFSVIFYVFSKINKNKTNYINKQDAIIIVTSSWLILGSMGALPYYFSEFFLSYTDSFFESVSGYTTTGSSILTDIEKLPHNLLFYRALTHWIGGIGIILIAIIILPTLNIGGNHLFSLESSLQDKILPKIKDVSKRLFLIYIALTLAEISCLLLANMNLFESICHAFATVSTGGFSPKNTSIASYSAIIQYIICLFMALSGVNFILYYYVIKKDFYKIKINDEFKLYIYILITFILSIFISIQLNSNLDWEENFRKSAFQFVSIVTCTGFATDDYLLWPQFASALILIGLFIGGCTGSTSGGIKVMRHVVLIKNIKLSIMSSFFTNHVFSVRINKRVIDTYKNSSILTFIILYILIVLIGTVILLFFNIDFMTAFSSVATAMAGAGPGFGTVGPVSNFFHLPDFVKLVLSLFMIIGRLEIYTFIAILFRKFWYI